MILSKERRKYFRLNAYHLLKYKIAGKSDALEVLAFVKDISAGGVRFHVQEKLPLGTVIELEINFPGYPEAVRAKAKVVRVTQLKGCDECAVGAEFIDISESAKNFINDKIGRVREKIKGGGLVRTFSLLFLLAGVASFAVGVSLQLARGTNIFFESGTWVTIAQMCLFFSIATSLLKQR